MTRTYVTNMRHCAEPADWDGVPTPAINIARYLGSIVGWVSSHPFPPPERTNIPCRKRPGRRPCPGDIHASFEEGTSTIIWHCPSCGENGYISNWEGTVWDQQEVLPEPA